jgi:hypothetical protein
MHSICNFRCWSSFKMIMISKSMAAKQAQSNIQWNSYNFNFVPWIFIAELALKLQRIRKLKLAVVEMEASMKTNCSAPPIWKLNRHNTISLLTGFFEGQIAWTISQGKWETKFKAKSVEVSVYFFTKE